MGNRCFWVALSTATIVVACSSMQPEMKYRLSFAKQRFSGYANVCVKEIFNLELPCKGQAKMTVEDPSVASKSIPFDWQSSGVNTHQKAPYRFPHLHC